MNYNEMKVAELREESRKRGMTLECKGHKFTKSELIERLEKSDSENKDVQSDIDKQIEEAGETKEHKKNVHVVVRPENSNYIKFAETLEEIEEKYSFRKKQFIYDEKLKVGSMVVFIHYVEAADGNIYKKLRTAKVIAVNRKTEKVRVETLLGDVFELNFEELLYIRDEKSSYPLDIRLYMKKRTTEKGRALINEKFGTN